MSEFAGYGKVGVWQAATTWTPRFASELEALGYSDGWIGLGLNEFDHFDYVDTLLSATSRLTLTMSIVNVWGHQASEIARSFHRIEHAHPGRYILGIGIGHPEVMSAYRSPIDTIQRFLDGLDDHGVPAGRRILAALGPKALSIAGERTLGAHPYLVPPAHSRDARRLLGAGPVLAPEHKVVVDADVPRARNTARRALTPYFGLRNYMSNLQRLGYGAAELRAPGSNRVIDDLVANGTAEHVVTALRSHLDAGADHIAVQVVSEPGTDPLNVYRALAKPLSKL